jgi:hypothetical protein
MGKPAARDANVRFARFAWATPMHSPKDRNSASKQSLFSSQTQKQTVEPAFARETDVLDKLETEVKV